MFQDYLFTIWLCVLATFSLELAAQTGIRKVQKGDNLMMQVWDGRIVFDKSIVIPDEVTIMPQAYVTSKTGAVITFTKKVIVLGESEIFSPTVTPVFYAGTINEFNVTWFGAKGYDHDDDTKAFQRTFNMATAYPGVANVVVPSGRYFISETLRIEGDPESRKAINVSGAAMSNDGIQGASLSWTGDPGGTLLHYRHTGQCILQHLDLTAEPGRPLKYNVDLRPNIHSFTIRHCSFSGCGGQGSANISLNQGNGDQVSEIRIESCAFNGFAPGSDYQSMSAISGGLANTKNFYIRHCGFNQYYKAAVDILNSEVVMVEGCTFSNNQLDILCALCGAYVAGNFSEHSKAFFSSGFSANIAFNTLINNYFIGQPESGWVIPDGSGSLVMINNDFGGADQRDEHNRVRWEENPFSPIYSIGNFYKNASPALPPFFNRSGQPRQQGIFSTGDVGGRNAENRSALLPMAVPSGH